MLKVETKHRCECVVCAQVYIGPGEPSKPTLNTLQSSNIHGYISFKPNTAGHLNPIQLDI